MLVTASFDRTARVLDRGDPIRELARFGGHDDDVRAVTVLPWPDRDHPVLATTSDDGTARVWDPHDPGRDSPA